MTKRRPKRAVHSYRWNEAMIQVVIDSFNRQGSIKAVAMDMGVGGPAISNMFARKGIQIVRIARFKRRGMGRGA